jgi:uncharacterized Zn finger protein
MARWRDRYEWGYYPKSRPIETKGGIKAQSRSGAFGASWWAQRWIDVLEGFDIGARLGRGRSYARKGQVLSIEIEPGVVRARVQGSRPKPYEVTIKTSTVSAAERSALANELARQALFTAKLLAGEMPRDIEDAFRAAGVSLFPGRRNDLATSCSCPDWSNPCKHVAAVYYLLGEEFDRDPFLIFTLRGLTRADLVSMLHVATPPPSQGSVTPIQQPDPLPASAEVFWSGRTLDGAFFGTVEFPKVSAALPRRLGKFPFWRGAQPLAEALEACYRSASARGMEAVTGADLTLSDETTVANAQPREGD